MPWHGTYIWNARAHDDPGLVSWVLVWWLATVTVTAEHVQPRGPRCSGSADYHITKLQSYHRSDLSTGNATTITISRSQIHFVQNKNCNH